MKIDENEFFRQVTLRISSSLDVEKAMQSCMQYLQRYIPVAGMYFGLYDPVLNVGRMLATLWPEHLPEPGETISFPQELWDVLKENFGDGPRIKLINDVNKEEEQMRKALSLIWPLDCSHLKMELKLEGAKLGSFGIFTEGKNRYSEAHARLIDLLHEPFAVAISNILQHQEIVRLKNMLADENRYLHQEMLQLTGDKIVGANFGLRNVMRMVDQVAPLNSPVILMGETGTGKEVIANAIHSSSTRREGSFIKVNCGAIPDNLIDSELFGHEKGAFTGAISRKRGRFERAHNGTIFLDEIGELPLPAQVRLLRVIQQHEIERVGGTKTIPVNVRILSATHRNLEEMVRRGTFREDLWFRLNVFPITIPPLRQRTVDIPALVDHFLERKSMDLKVRRIPPLAQSQIEKLQAYAWPGNVRELENLVERALILNQMDEGRGSFTFDSILTRPWSVSAVSVVKEKGDPIRPLDEVVAGHIRNTLAHTKGRVEGIRGAAHLLDLHPSTLRARMKKLGVPYGRQTKFQEEKPNDG